MANFDNNAEKTAAADRANGLVGSIQGAVGQMRAMKAGLALYQAGTDPFLVTAVNGRYSAGVNGERAEIAAVIGLFNTLLTELDANHSAILQA